MTRGDGDAPDSSALAAVPCGSDGSGKRTPLTIKENTGARPPRTGPAKGVGFMLGLWRNFPLTS